MIFMFSRVMSMVNKQNILIVVICCVGCEIIDPIEPYHIYRTSYGSNVKLENINGPKQTMIEVWTKETLDFWRNVFNDATLDCMANEELPITQITFFDSDSVLCSDNVEQCNGVTIPYERTIKISNGTEYKLYITFIHELSHVLFNCMRETYKANDIDHNFFFKVGLERFFKRKYVDDRITH